MTVDSTMWFKKKNKMQNAIKGLLFAMMNARIIIKIIAETEKNVDMGLNREVDKVISWFMLNI